MATMPAPPRRPLWRTVVAYAWSLLVDFPLTILAWGKEPKKSLLARLYVRSHDFHHRIEGTVCQDPVDREAPIVHQPAASGALTASGSGPGALGTAEASGGDRSGSSETGEAPRS